MSKVGHKIVFLQKIFFWFLSTQIKTEIALSSIWFVCKKDTQKNLLSLEKSQISNSLSEPRKLKTELSMLCLMFHAPPNSELWSVENCSFVNSKALFKNYIEITKISRSTSWGEQVWILYQKKKSIKKEYEPIFYWHTDACKLPTKYLYLVGIYLFKISNSDNRNV